MKGNFDSSYKVWPPNLGWVFGQLFSVVTKLYNKVENQRPRAPLMGEGENR